MNMDSKMIDVLSLGAGVQSSTILLMACIGELPKPKCAIFADTGWEPAATYRHLEFLRGEATKAGIEIRQVAKGNIRNDALVSQVRGVKTAGTRWASMPLYTLQPDGQKGMIRRQCTSEYKIAPLEKEMKRIAGIQPRQRVKEPMVRMWIGISRDEASRMRDSQVKWQVLYYPLIEKDMTRNDCLQWMESRGFPRPPKSSCIGCPFHSDHEWRTMSAEDFADACEVDEKIRKCGGMRGDVYLHRSCKPLREVDFSTAEDRGQINWINECLGMCGV